ncbi:uncharacterized protein BYT42DRAFT_479951, partial [Radiomyces spectabilis]|uniref:uncharacterized protein n=1 Tax=Radiomyces spectabilis TaxID=64574 RepID=UPI002220327B
MGRSRRTNKLHIHLENEHLIMHGSPHESAGCVLRGVLNLTLKKPTRVKSMMMRFTGKMSISWNEPVGKGHERMVKEEKIIMHHHWWFLPMQAQMYRLGAGSHPFEFELPLPGNLPESTQVANLYLVDYQLKAVVQRPTFLPDYVSKRTLHLSRQMLPLTPDFMEPVSLQNQWVGKIDYEIMMPTKIYTRGEDIPLTIRMTPCVNNLKIRFVACTFKEYMTCRAAHGLFGGKTRSHNRILRYVRDDNLNHTCRRGVPWSTILQVPVPRLPDEVHCDVQTDVVRIRHKLKFVLSIENTDGHLSELRAVLPVTICAMKLAGLPAYEETWQSMPYEP